MIDVTKKKFFEQMAKFLVEHMQNQKIKRPSGVKEINYVVQSVSGQEMILTTYIDGEEMSGSITNAITIDDDMSVTLETKCRTGDTLSLFTKKYTIPDINVRDNFDTFLNVYTDINKPKLLSLNDFIKKTYECEDELEELCLFTSEILNSTLRTDVGLLLATGENDSKLKNVKKEVVHTRVILPAALTPTKAEGMPDQIGSKDLEDMDVFIYMDGEEMIVSSQEPREWNLVTPMSEISGYTLNSWSYSRDIYEKWQDSKEIAEKHNELVSVGFTPTPMFLPSNLRENLVFSFHDFHYVGNVVYSKEGQPNIHINVYIDNYGQYGNVIVLERDNDRVVISQDTLNRVILDNVTTVKNKYDNVLGYMKM